MSVTRTTYRALASVVAQLSAAQCLQNQIASRISDEWRQSDVPELQANYTAIADSGFLDSLEEDGLHVDILSALHRLRLRFEWDGAEDGSDSPFTSGDTLDSIDQLLSDTAELFHEQLRKRLPKCWQFEDTLWCLSWENLIVVPDIEQCVGPAIAFFEGKWAAS